MGTRLHSCVEICCRVDMRGFRMAELRRAARRRYSNGREQSAGGVARVARRKQAGRVAAAVRQTARHHTRRQAGRIRDQLVPVSWRHAYPSGVRWPSDPAKRVARRPEPPETEPRSSAAAGRCQSATRVWRAGGASLERRLDAGARPDRPISPAVISSIASSGRHCSRATRMGWWWRSRGAAGSCMHPPAMATPWTACVSAWQRSMPEDRARDCHRRCTCSRTTTGPCSRRRKRRPTDAAARRSIARSERNAVAAAVESQHGCLGPDLLQHDAGAQIGALIEHLTVDDQHPLLRILRIHAAADRQLRRVRWQAARDDAGFGGSRRRGSSRGGVRRLHLSWCRRRGCDRRASGAGAEVPQQSRPGRGAAPSCGRARGTGCTALFGSTGSMRGAAGGGSTAVATCCELAAAAGTAATTGALTPAAAGVATAAAGAAATASLRGWIGGMAGGRSSYVAQNAQAIASTAAAPAPQAQFR